MNVLFGVTSDRVYYPVRSAIVSYCFATYANSNNEYVTVVIVGLVHCLMSSLLSGGLPDQ